VYPVDARPTGPRIVGTLLDGSTFDASTLMGHVAVVNFWASDCAPCRAEAADLEAIYVASRHEGVVFLGVDVRDSKDAAVAFMRGRITYPSVFDPAGRVCLQFRDLSLRFVPATVVLDRHGDVAAVFHAAVSRSDLQSLVSQVAAEPV
jgi:thiol-disulfide isomerase/thioredoxin